MTTRTYQRLQALILLLTLSVLGASFYFQYAMGLKPCPLCLMQRGCIILLSMVCLRGLYWPTPKRMRVMVGLQLLFATAGLFFAIRQVWLQSLPAGQVPACMPGLNVLIHYFPWPDILRAFLWGTGDCAELTWQWLGLSLPAWSAIYFLSFVLFSGVLLWRLSPSEEHRLHR